MDHFYQNIQGWSRQESQGDLLRYILSKYDTKYKLKICEIGVYMGRCTALWNVELINNNFDYEYYAIDHFEGSSEHINSGNIPNYDIALKNLNPIIDRINLIKSDSISASKNFSDENFDIVYIDASHEYEHVKQDILHWLPKVKKGGFLCGDDYHPTWDGVIKAVDEIFKEDKKEIGFAQWITKK